MNRGVLQSSPVQQMMAGNPNWWSIDNMRAPPTHHHHHHHQQTLSPSFLQPPLPPTHLFPQYMPSPPSSSPLSSTSSFTTTTIPSWPDNQDQLPESWSQLLLGGLVGDEAKGNISHLQVKKMENWEAQELQHQVTSASIVDVKQENSASSYVYGHASEDHFQAAPKPTWSPMLPAAAASPKSCVTSFNSNLLDFSTNKAERRHPPADPSSECNNSANGGALKKARVQPTSTQSTTTTATFKVRKEKLGDRITALHQLVSPFGKTDTASVLLEAIGYIRFLQSQIEALSLPYLGSGSSSNMRQKQPQSVQGERSCIFHEDSGQLFNDGCIKRKGASEQDAQEEPKKDLRSRGLCLVPVSCTLQVGGDNGADYWAPAIGGGFQ